MLEKAKTSATRKDEHGLARMVFEGVDLTPDDAAQMKRIKARVAIEETIRVMMEKGADDEAIEKATLAIDAKTKVGVFERQIWNQRFVQAKENVWNAFEEQRLLEPPGRLVRRHGLNLL